MFVDFLDNCLEWKVDKRLTPEQAFQHPWIKQGILELKQKIESNQQEGTASKNQKQPQPSAKKKLPNISQGSQSNRNTQNSN